jgi:uncharacterized protein (TIGR02001 family)
MPSIVRAACLLSCALALLPAHADGLSGDVVLTSDYLFRGVSQSQGDPALQAGLRYTHASGAYVAGWTSNIDYGPGFEDVDREFDAMVGIERTLGTVSLDLSYARYLYPGARPHDALDYSEWLLTAGVGERVSATFGWTPDVFASGTSGTYLQLAYTYPVGRDISLRAALGEYRFGGPLADYRHAELGAAWSRGRWEGRVTWHATSDAARDNFGAQAARGLVEVAVKAGF